MVAQKQSCKWIYQKIQRTQTGVLWSTPKFIPSNCPRKKAQKLEACLENRFDWKKQSFLERFVRLSLIEQSIWILDKNIPGWQFLGQDDNFWVSLSIKRRLRIYARFLKTLEGQLSCHLTVTWFRSGLWLPINTVFEKKLPWESGVVPAVNFGRISLV